MNKLTYEVLLDVENKYGNTYKITITEGFQNNEQKTTHTVELQFPTLEDAYSFGFYAQEQYARLAQEGMGKSVILSDKLTNH